MRFSENRFANFCQIVYYRRMSTMNISLPDALTSFVDEQAQAHGFGTSSENQRSRVQGRT